MNTNDCLKKSIDNFNSRVSDAFRYSRRDEECNKDQNIGIAKAMIKVAGLNIKSCSVYGKLTPVEVISNTEKISNALINVCYHACDGSDLDSVLNEISDIGTQILGMADTSLNNCISN
jgi:hypothetical protein